MGHRADMCRPFQPSISCRHPGGHRQRYRSAPRTRRPDSRAASAAICLRSADEMTGSALRAKPTAGLQPVGARPICLGKQHQAWTISQFQIAGLDARDDHALSVQHGHCPRLLRRARLDRDARCRRGDQARGQVGHPRLDLPANFHPRRRYDGFRLGRCRVDVPIAPAAVAPPTAARGCRSARSARRGCQRRRCWLRCGSHAPREGYSGCSTRYRRPERSAPTPSRLWIPARGCCAAVSNERMPVWAIGV